MFPVFSLQKKQKETKKTKTKQKYTDLINPIIQWTSINIFKTLVKLGSSFLVFQENFENFQNGHCIWIAAPGGYGYLFVITHAEVQKLFQTL